MTLSYALQNMGDLKQLCPQEVCLASVQHASHAFTVSSASEASFFTFAFTRRSAVQLQKTSAYVCMQNMKGSPLRCLSFAGKGTPLQRCARGACMSPRSSRTCKSPFAKLLKGMDWTNPDSRSREERYRKIVVQSITGIHWLFCQICPWKNAANKKCMRSAMANCTSTVKKCQRYLLCRCQESPPPICKVKSVFFCKGLAWSLLKDWARHSTSYIS